MKNIDLNKTVPLNQPERETYFFTCHDAETGEHLGATLKNSFEAAQKCFERRYPNRKLDIHAPTYMGEINL